MGAMKLFMRWMSHQKGLDPKCTTTLLTKQSNIQTSVQDMQNMFHKQVSFHHQLCRASIFLSQWNIVTRKFHAIQNFQTPPTTLSEGIFSASMVSVNAFQEIYTSKGQPTNGSLRNYLKPYSRHWFPQRTISAPYLLPISKTPVLVAVEPR